MQTGIKIRLQNTDTTKALIEQLNELNENIKKLTEVIYEQKRSDREV